MKTFFFVMMLTFVFDASTCSNDKRTWEKANTVYISYPYAIEDTSLEEASLKCEKGVKNIRTSLNARSSLCRQISEQEYRELVNKVSDKNSPMQVLGD